MSKKRVIKDYDQMPQEILIQLKDRFPQGYQEHLLRFNNANGELISALPFDEEELTDELYSLSEAEVEIDQSEE